MSAGEIEIARDDGVSAEDCERMMLGSEPWKTLGYGAGDARAVAASSAKMTTRVARQDGIVVGFALSVSGFLTGEYLRLLVVDPRHRGGGIGRRLMEHLEAEVFARSTNLFLCVTDFNQSARAFYQRLGYVEVGRLDDLLVAGSAEILMRKTTGPARGR